MKALLQGYMIDMVIQLKSNIIYNYSRGKAHANKLRAVPLRPLDFYSPAL